MSSSSLAFFAPPFPTDTLFPNPGFLAAASFSSFVVAAIIPFPLISRGLGEMEEEEEEANFYSGVTILSYRIYFMCESNKVFLAQNKCQSEGRFYKFIITFSFQQKNCTGEREHCAKLITKITPPTAIFFVTAESYFLIYEIPPW